MGGEKIEDTEKKEKGSGVPHKPVSGAAGRADFAGMRAAAEAVASVTAEMAENDFPLDEEQRKIFDIIERTSRNVFIQGRAGTGKTTFIQYLRRHSAKKIRVVCPTAAAAVNLGAATIHSLFRLPLSDFFIFEDILSVPRKKLQSVLMRTDLLIIDEVSMVRPDMLDAVDLLSREARCNHLQPFGGMQVLLVGDLAQLPPVIKPGACEAFEYKYGLRQPYFFHSDAYLEGNFQKIEMEKVYRQNDTELLEQLGRIRGNYDIAAAAAYFNACGQATPEYLKTAVTLTPYRNVADSMNARRLSEICAPSRKYMAAALGTFETSKDCPAPRVLELKPGALIIFNRNNPGIWINGTAGTVCAAGDDSIEVELLGSGRHVCVQREEWKSYRYDFDRVSGRVVETETGTFTQFPLQLGYALTIHKAQGKTLDKVAIDVKHGAFAHGQIYVALSRTRRKEDIRLIGRICEEDIITDPAVAEFIKN